MSRPEAVIQAEILRCSRGPVRLFRNSVGQGWTGTVVRQEGDMVVLANARAVRFGLCDGSADLVGWHSLEITPAMVGQRLARFLAAEVKSATGRPSDAQRNFLAAVSKHGGAAGICRSTEDLASLLGEGVLL